MPGRKQPRRTDMKDIRSILRLTHESGLSVREVSERLGLSKSTVSTYLLRAREAGLNSWPMPEGCGDDAALERKLFRQMGRPPRDTTEPDWQLISREMKCKGVTRYCYGRNIARLILTASATPGSVISSAHTRSGQIRHIGIGIVLARKCRLIMRVRPSP